MATAHRIEHLDATLTGEQEVPGPGYPDGSGKAGVTVYSAKVCYGLRAEDIGRPIAAHIHEGRRGVAGDVVVELNTPEKIADALYLSGGCERISRALSTDLKKRPAHYYVNVHTNRFPDGAIRGQLHD